MHYNNVDIPSEARVGDFTSKPTELSLARWSERFFAWLIDFLIVSCSTHIDR